ncbi:tyrosine-type recombinase/integrase [Faecalicatena contorta]|uniref:tyrosine-type recombinase/integrase n=1 Tax=Faecalicatena contorta TaxID=39482 RepID=UPI00196196D1|nr:tyrosine-type recombinase/integrase [Faecalicatena contorta]MBM6685434.1 tyrosine-type recombinase/integrase [Faecalicatena contorta]MBM6710175.1 tyrosine-type recombinase/integrase [Faecalicatena contorta]
MKKIDRIKKELCGNVYSAIELDNLMAEKGFTQIEADDQIEDGVIKYTNCKLQFWLTVDRDSDGNILVSDVKSVTKVGGVATKVDPFHTFDDLNKVLLYFWNHDQYHHWLCGNLMVSFGRRVGDTLSLGWSDLFLTNGEYRERLATLQEEKTGKVVGVRIHDYAKECVRRYCETLNINPMEHYQESVFSIGDAAFRAALKKAVSEVGLTYPVSTHSFRKFYGNMMYKLHPQDADALSIVQSMFGHSDPNITKGYIGAIDEKIDKYNTDYAGYLIDSSKGKEVAFKNTPIYSLKSDDIRNIISIAYQLGKQDNHISDVEDINYLLSLVEEKRVV